MIHFHKHFIVLVVLLALASALTHAQSQRAGQLVMPLALGVLAFQGKNRHLSPAVSHDDIQVNSYESMWANGQAFLQEGSDDDNNHDVELPDEDNEDEPAPKIYGRVQGLNISIQGESIVYQRNGQIVTEVSSSLERVMQRYRLPKIELIPASFTLSLYAADHDPESPVNIITPSITEPVNPACGEWTGVDASLMGFVTYDSMDEIAAIAEAAMRRQSSDDYELTESVKEEKGEYSYVDVLANSSEGYLFTAEWLPQVFPESCMYEERQDNGTAHIELEYGFEGIELYGNTSRKGAWYYEFSHYKKNDGRSDEEDEQTSNDNDDSSSSDSAPDSSVSSNKRVSPYPQDASPPEPKKGNYSDKEIIFLPPEMVEKILLNLKNLPPRDVSVCKRICKKWRDYIDGHHIQPVSFYNYCHPMPSIPRLLKPVDCYHSSIRDSLRDFGSEGQTAIRELDQHKDHECFPEILFFSIARVLTKIKAFACELRGTIFHTDRVRNASFSPDGNHVATASFDNTAKIWGFTGGQWQEKATIPHVKWVKSASFSSDGNYIVTASYDDTAKVWEFVNGQWQEKATLSHEDSVMSASFSPDGNYIVTASYDNTAKIWGLVDGQWKENATIPHTHSVMNASFSPDGNYVVTASYDKAAKIWELVEGQWQEKATLSHENMVMDASFSPDGNHIVTICYDKTVRIWGLVEGKWKIKATIPHTDLVTKARFSPDGQHIVTASDDNTAKIWGLVDGEWQEQAIIHHTKYVRNAHFSPNGHQVVTTSHDDTAKVWGLVGGRWQEKATLSHTDAMRNARFSPDGRHILTASYDMTVKIWGLVDGQWKEKATFSHTDSVMSARFSPDGLHIVTASKDKTSKIFRLKSLENDDVF